MIEFRDFNNIRNPILRAWNRLNIIFNMKEMGNNRLSSFYMKKFPKKDKMAIYRLAQEIQNIGYEQVRRNIMRENNA